jgi:hypothetical protein
MGEALPCRPVAAALYAAGTGVHGRLGIRGALRRRGAVAEAGRAQLALVSPPRGTAPFLPTHTSLILISRRYT